MGKTSAKNKIILLAVGWFVLSTVMFFYLFGILDGVNEKTVTTLTKQKNDLTLLQAQKQGYAQGKSDLEKLAQQPMHLTDFFSRDITLVNEIKTLENLSTKYPVKMQLSGISGVINSEPKANTKTSIVQVPYNISVSGTFPAVTDFMEALEHLSFITDITSISVSTAEKDQVTTSFSAHLYLAN
jgi:Tfp pilus assembly protein PilO